MIRWIFLLTISFFVSDTQAGCDSCLKDSWCGCETVAPPCCSGYYWDDDIDGRNCWFSAYFKCKKCTCSRGHKRSGCSCDSCPAGSYQPNDDSRATSCTACDAGQYSGTGWQTCSPCSTGQYASSSGWSECGICDAGKYASGVATECSWCPNGQISSSKGASSCTTCAAGKYDSVTSCKNCNAGQYSSAGSSSCSTCSIGQYSSGSASECTACPAGQYQHQTGQSGCNNCDAGYGTTAGASSKAGCGACPKGKSSVSGGACTACSAGKYQDQTTQSACKLCATGKYLRTEGNDAASDCGECPAGKVNPGGSSWTDYDSIEDCDNCDAGKHQEKTGQASCKICGAGKYAVAGSSQCYECEPGYYFETSGATSQFACKGCPGGFFQESRGAAACKECSAGRYENDLPGGANQQGSTGTLVIETSTTYGCTQVCQPGTYQDQTGQSVCKDCGAGKYSTVTEAATNTCQSCPTGKYSSSLGANSANMCISCPAGRYQTQEGASSESDCLYCPVGKYSQSGKNECISCDPRKVTGVLTGATNCNFATCSNGYLSEGRANCEKCPEGEYLNYDGGDSTCKQCSSQLPRSNGTSCYRCLPGRHRGSCSVCPAGRYTGWESELLTECRPCQAGYQDEEGQGTCKNCPAGRISSDDRTTCVTCPLGEYSDAENLIECKTCPTTGKQHTGIIGQKDGECTAGNTKGIHEYSITKGISVELIELSGSNNGNARNLQRCVGECDSILGDNDAQCAPGLKCFQRSNNEPIPGCKGSGGGRDWDYCYDPQITDDEVLYGFTAKLNDVILNQHSTFTTACGPDYYQNTFDGSCKGCPVGLYKEGTDPPSLKIVGPNDFNVCKFCSEGRRYFYQGCIDCVVMENKVTLKDFPYQACRYADCPEGSFAQNGECSECPTGTYWESKPVIGIPYENYILHSCDQMETQFHADLTAAQRTIMKTDCERCYTNPVELEDMGPSMCTSTTHFSGGFQSPSLKIYDDLDAPTNPGNTLEEERDACATACRNFVTTDGHIRNRDGDNLEITGFIIWVQESRRGMCYCAVNTDLTTCTISSSKLDTVRTYRFGSAACQAGKDLHAATSTYAGLCRSCPAGQYQDSTGQVTCKSCSTTTSTGATSC